jgi:hypothetical protein
MTKFISLQTPRAVITVRLLDFEEVAIDCTDVFLGKLVVGVMSCTESGNYVFNGFGDVGTELFDDSPVELLEQIVKLIA